MSTPETAATDEQSVSTLAELLDLARLAATGADPGAEALTDGRRSLTWREYADGAARLASALLDVGVQPGDRVAVHLGKSVTSFVTVHAVLRAGGVVVPLDPLAPPEHAALVLTDAGAAVVVTDARPASLSALLDAAGRRVRAVVRPLHDEPAVGDRDVTEVLADRIAADPAGPPVPVDADAPAYIIYTSGSTGVPKGIVHTHASALAYAGGAVATYGLGPHDRLANIAPLHFDQSTFELYAAPLAGAATIVVPDPVLRFPASLSQLVAAHRATVWYSVPYVLIQLATRGVLDERDLSSLRWVLFGGENFPPGRLAELMRRLPAARFSNVYGPAEVNQCTHHHLDEPPVGTERIPIGAAWAWADLRIVTATDHTTDHTTEDATLAAPGAPGELWVRTPTMMSHYWNRPELTAAAVVSGAAVTGIGDGRWYRTGDLVVERSDGLLDFLGRIDNQIKLRGHRVELEAVDAALRALDGVAEATTVVDRAPQDAGHTGDDRLVALVVADPAAAAPLDVRAASSTLARRLPRYAVPASILSVPDLPRTTSGKVDRRAAHDLLAAHPDR